MAHEHVALRRAKRYSRFMATDAEYVKGSDARGAVRAIGRGVVRLNPAIAGAMVERTDPRRGAR